MKKSPTAITGIALVSSDPFCYIAHTNDGHQHYGRFYLQRNGLVAAAPVTRKPVYDSKYHDLLIVGNMKMSKL